MKPTAEEFRKIAEKHRGNLSSMARAIGVARSTIGVWVRTDEDFSSIVKDCRMRLFDSALDVANVLALGIPETDPNGKIVGWIERPDGNMVRYLLSTLGKEEGFGEEMKIEHKLNLKDGGVPIDKWLELSSTEKETENVD